MDNIKTKVTSEFRASELVRVVILTRWTFGKKPGFLLEISQLGFLTLCVRGGVVLKMRSGKPRHQHEQRGQQQHFGGGSNCSLGRLP